MRSFVAGVVKHLHYDEQVFMRHSPASRVIAARTLESEGARGTLTHCRAVAALAAGHVPTMGIFALLMPSAVAPPTAELASVPRGHSDKQDVLVGLD